MSDNASGPGLAPDMQTAVELLRRGGVVCIPTETFYGLAVDMASQAGLAELTRIKGRDPSSPFALIAADRAQARSVARVWPPRAEALAARFWPGPLTLVVPAANHLAAELLGPGGGVGVRISSHPVPVALARALGRPITATSANPSGLPAACDVAQARAYFGDRIMYLDGGPTPGNQASTVIAIHEGGDLTILRPGPIAIPDDME